MRRLKRRFKDFKRPKIGVAILGLLLLSAFTESSCSNLQNNLAVAPEITVNPHYVDHRPLSCPTNPNSLTFTQLNGKPVKKPLSVLPSNFTADGNDWKLSSKRTTEPNIYLNPQELCGTKGMSVDRAWSYTMGSPNVTIAVIDSGIEWCDPDVVNKIAINPHALPPPENALGLTKIQLLKAKKQFIDTNPYDLNNSGIVNVAQYAQDPRVAAVANAYGGYFCTNQNNYNYHGISPEDLIRTFSKKHLPNGDKNPYYVSYESPKGFIDAIAGWNFVNNNNDPYDVVHYDHGTGEAEDSAGQAGVPNQEVGTCPSCLILPIRVSDSFIALGNNFAQAVAFAVDSSVNVIQEALGTLDITKADQEAINYAYKNGIPVIASAADEESFHQNLPASLQHMIVVNSITRDTHFNPPSYLYLNGCTNFGANIAVTVESTSCSSEATGKAAGIVGLIESYALKLQKEGKLKPLFINSMNQPVMLSVNEVKQLLTMTADDIDFTDPVKTNNFYAPKDNFEVTSTNIPLATTTRYPTTKGFDPYTGYGRINAVRIMAFLSQHLIPPTAEINSPSWFNYYTLDQNINISATLGDKRNPKFYYQIDVGYSNNPKGNMWHVIKQGYSQKPLSLVSVSVNTNQIAKLFPKNIKTISLNSANPNNFTFSIKIEVKSSNGLVGFARRSEFLHYDPSLLTSKPLILNSSVIGTPKLAPLGPNNTNVLLIATADGNIHAFLPNGSELPGWPVHSLALNFHGSEKAFTSGSIKSTLRGEIIGSVAVGHLSAKGLDVVASDTNGYVYAWNSKGQLLPGWPAKLNPAFSSQAAANEFNRVLPGSIASPVIANLQGSQNDVIVAGLDRHLYAFSPQGQTLPGFPVLVVDPSEVSSVNPVTNQVTFKDPSSVLQGSKIVDTPALFYLKGSKHPVIIVGTNEQYKDNINANLASLGKLLSAGGLSKSFASSRLYAIWPNGYLHNKVSPLNETAYLKSPFLPNWPVPIEDIDPSLLPDIGDGITQSPTVIQSPSAQVIAAQATAGPIYLLKIDGSSYLGNTLGQFNTLIGQPNLSELFTNSNQILNTPIPALGSPLIYLNPATKQITVISPAVTIGRLLDSLFPANQSPHLSVLAMFNLNSQAVNLTKVNDLEFFIQPVIANFTQNKIPYVFVQSSLYDTRGVSLVGQTLNGFPKFTGAWLVSGPTLGTFDNLSTLISATRFGQVFIYKVPAVKSCSYWPMVYHDLLNTNNNSTQSGSCP